MFLSSYDICSLFTNVPLAETIEICSQALYNGDLPEPIIPKHVFTDLMKIATFSVEFSFNNCMYRQIDGVAMGSPLGPALANFFVGFYESELFDKISKPQIYYCYVDDTFALFQDEVDSETFLTNLNSLHICIHPQRCPVYLKLPWIGETSIIFEKKIKSNILNCFSTVQPRVIFSTRRILPAIHKDVLPASQQSVVVYQYVCRCECRYVARTSQRLQNRIRQHVPKTIRNKTNQERIQPTRKNKINSSTPICDSAIGTHLLKHPNCALHYSDDQFSILSKTRSEFHLVVLESIHITSSKSALCRQKEFVYRLKLST